MNELVSVVMSTYNEKNNELKESINSILNQTYSNIELIIVNDNPENKSINKFLQELKKTNKEIVLITNSENLGLAKSLNKAIDLARGSYIARMDADDISFRDRIKKQVDFLQDNNLDMLASNRVDIDEEGNIISGKSSLPHSTNIINLLPIGNFITHPTVLIKSDVIKSLGGYRNFKSAQDYDLWLRLLSENYKIGILDEPLIYYRLRNSGISNSDKFRQYLYTKYQQKLYKERINENIDSFSEYNLELYLRGNKYYNFEYKEKFNSSNKSLEYGFILIKKKIYIKGIKLVIKSVLQNRHVANKFIDTLKYKIKLSI